MSDLKPGSFASVMEGLDEELDAAEAAAEETTEEVEEETTEEVVEDTEEDVEDEEEEVEDETSDEEEPDTEPATEEDDEPISFTVKVDGKQREVDEEELVRGYQNGKASTTRFYEAKKMHDEAKALVENLLKKPGDALESFLVKKHKGDRVAAHKEVRDLFLEHLAPDLEESLIEDEREKELHRQRRELEMQRKELEHQKNEAKSRLDREAEQEFIADLKLSLDTNIKRYKLPQDNAIVNKAADILETARAAGSSNEELLDLVPAVIQSIKEERAEAKMEFGKASAKDLTPEELEELYPEQLKALRKKRIERVKKKKAGKAKKKEEEVPLKPKKKVRKQRQVFNSNDVFNDIDLSEFDD